MSVPSSSAVVELPLIARHVLSQLPLAIMVAGADERILFANARYLELFGLPPDTPIVGQYGREWLQRIASVFAEPAVTTVVAQDAADAQRGIAGQRVVLTDGRILLRSAETLPEGGWLVTYQDVTAEERARQELASIAQIPEQNPHPVFRVTADGRALYRNAAALAMPDGLSGDNIIAGLGQVGALIGPALASGENQQATLAADGCIFDVYIVPFPAEQYVNLYLVETTDRHTAEAETQRQRAFYEAILEYLPADVAVIDPDLRYRYLNPQALRDPELRDWIIGRDEVEYYAYLGRPRTEAERRQKVLRTALADGRQVSWEEVRTHHDGTTQYLTRFAQPVFDEDGAPLMLIGYGLDITPIREAQLTQARSEKQYRDLMEYTQALICTHDLAGTILSVNPAIAELLGAAPEELIGRPLADLMPPEDQLIVAEYLAQFATGPNATSTGVLRVLPRHAKRPSYLLYHNIRIEEAGQAPYVIGYAQDISERIRAERATVKAKETAEASARARESFLANMSHEIRTPLNGVLGVAALLDRTPLNAEQQQYVGLIRTAGRSLLALLNDVLDMSKISSGKLDLASVPFDLRTTVREAAQPLAMRAAERGISFRFDPLPLPTTGLLGDPQRLTQILTNLLSNAVKFTEQGSVTLQGRLRRATPAALTVTFTVSDTGIGIMPAQQEKIFDEFTQAYTDTSQRFGGTGLGLAISERLVRQLGGCLVLSSEPGVGTTFGFTLTLPRTELVPVSATPSAAVLGDIAGLRVLLVEDHPVNRLLARLMLTHNGAVVTEAVTGVEAVAWVQAEQFDIVLMDIQMPEMNGLQATAAIRALPDPRRAVIPILALTANAFRADTERYVAAGMNGCLTKPFEEAELIRLLGELVPRVGQGRAAEGAVLAKEEAVTPAFPATALALARGNRLFVRQIVTEFLATTPQLLGRLSSAAPAQGAEVAAIAHQLRPSAQTFDAAEAAAALAELEDLPADDVQWEAVRDYVVQELDALLEQLRHWLAAELPPAGSTPEG